MNKGSVAKEIRIFIKSSVAFGKRVASTLIKYPFSNVSKKASRE
jgi:hypothetical protein